jgi:alpha-aminoadipate/glutamate carrier protein LysW
MSLPNEWLATVCDRTEAEKKRLLQNLSAAVRLWQASHNSRWRTPRRFGCAAASLEFAWEVENVPTGTCPECDADVHVDLDTDKGETVSCDECGAALEVVGLDPVELDIVEEEDLDDDDEDDEF